MGSYKGALKIAAKRIGVSLPVYLRRISNGKKWCTNCKAWHNRNVFSKDTLRYDGLHQSCAESYKRLSKERYVPKPRPLPGRRFVAARSGDVKQARRRVNYLVDSGLIPHPNELPCFDCGHIWEAGERRHEYDHYLGYAAAHHEDVQPACTLCHVKREKARKNG